MLGVILGRLEIDLTSIVPVENFDVVVLFEQVDEERQSKGKSIIVEESFGGNFLVNLLLASGHVLNIVDSQTWNDHVELFQVFVFLRGYFRASFYHNVHVVDFVTEFLLQRFQDLVKFFAT